MIIKNVWIRAIWLFIALSGLVFALVFREEEGGLLIFSLLMLVISFPLGAALAVVIWVIANSLEGILAPGTEIEIFVYWFIFVLGGYAQWFWLLPKFLRQSTKYSRPTS